MHAKCVHSNWSNCSTSSIRANTASSSTGKDNLNDRAVWLCSKAFFATLRVLIVVSRIVQLIPLQQENRVGGGRVYRTQRLHTVCSLAALLSLVAAAPFLVRNHTAVYGYSSIRVDARFTNIAIFSLASDLSVSLLLSAAALWQRKRLAKFLNDCERVVRVVRLRLDMQDFVSWPKLLVLWLRAAHFLYGMCINLPFICKHAGDLHPLALVALAVTLVLEQLRTIFALDMIALVLLLTACYGQLAHRLATAAGTLREDTSVMGGLFGVANALERLVRLYRRTFQLGLLLLLLGDFINLLANLYGMVYRSVYSRRPYPNLIAFNLSLVIDLYSLVFCAQWCIEQRQVVREAFLSRNCDETARSLIFDDPLWPLQVELSILGLFSLNHEFWLFLVSYAVNFIVIILEFAIKESNRT